MNLDDVESSETQESIESFPQCVRSKLSRFAILWVHFLGSLVAAIAGSVGGLELQIQPDDSKGWISAVEVDRVPRSTLKDFEDAMLLAGQRLDGRITGNHIKIGAPKLLTALEQFYAIETGSAWVGIPSVKEFPSWRRQSPAH